MSWSTLDPKLRSIAETELTPLQLDVLKLFLAGCGHKRISIMLGISHQAARNARRRAFEKLEPYLTEHSVR